MPSLFIQNLQHDPAYYFAVLLTVVVSTVLHELGHVFAALRQGDETPRLLGHVTLDPMVHMGPRSLFLAAFVGISWGLTPVNPNNFRGRYGRAYVSLAGPLVNLALALIALTLLSRLLHGDVGQLRTLGEPEGRNNLHMFLFVFGFTNVVLFLLNLLPLPPLDGGTVAADLSPAYAALQRQPEAQPWFLAGAIAAIMLLPFFPWAIELSIRYLQLWN